MFYLPSLNSTCSAIITSTLRDAEKGFTTGKGKWGHHGRRARGTGINKTMSRDAEQWIKCRSGNALLKQLKLQGKKTPHLAAILVGNDGGSLTYVNAKVKACEQIGFDSSLIKYDDISEADLLAKVHELNNDDNIDGFIVQLPLPSHIDELKITNCRPSI